MTAIALRVVCSAGLGILTTDLIRPGWQILVIFIIATALIGLVIRKSFYITIFLLAGLNYTLVYPQVHVGDWITGTGDVIGSRPYYGSRLITIKSRNGILETVTKDNLENSRVYFSGFVKKDYKNKIRVEAVRILEISPVSNKFTSLFTYLRNGIIFTIKRIAKKDNQGLLTGLLLGRIYYPKSDLWDFFAQAGIIHLLTVSGLHVGFVLSLGVILFSFLGIRRRRSYLFALMFIPIYAGITGFRLPVIRASLMLGMLGVANYIERKVPPIHFLLIALLILLIFDPVVIFSPGAQLSFIAAGGIILLYPELSKFLPQKRIPRYILASLVVSFSAQLATAPVLIHYFHRIPTLGVITNLLVVPLAWWAVALGFLTIFIYQIMPLLANILAGGLNLVLDIIIIIAQQVSYLSFSSLQINWLPVLIYPPFYMLFIKKIRIYGLIALLAIANIYLFLPPSYRIDVENKKFFVSPPCIDCYQLTSIGQLPANTTIDELKIFRINEHWRVRLGSVHTELKNGTYHITKSGIVEQKNISIFHKFYDELRLIWFRMKSIF